MNKTIILSTLFFWVSQSAFSQWNNTSNNSTTGNLTVGSTTSNSYSKIVLRGPNSPTGINSKRDFIFDFNAAGEAFIRSYRGSSWDTYLQFMTSAYSNTGGAPSVRMHINGDGKVGIGTTTPSSQLDVLGDLKISATSLSAGTSALQINNTWANNSNDFEMNRPLTIARSASDNEAMNIYVQDASTLFTYKNDEAQSRIHFRMINTDTESGGGANANDNYVMSIKGDQYGGSVSIGLAPTPAGYQFSVDGKAIMEEVVVKLATGWPDYVFSEEYLLEPLESVEKFIKKNKHLPNIPSSTAMDKSDGISLGEMNIRLLEKIEELTLYTINQEKEIKQLKSKQASYTDLESRLEELTLSMVELKKENQELKNIENEKK